jgi:hypothetical protein
VESPPSLAQPQFTGTEASFFQRARAGGDELYVGGGCADAVFDPVVLGHGVNDDVERTTVVPNSLDSVARDHGVDNDRYGKQAQRRVYMWKGQDVAPDVG